MTIPSSKPRLRCTYIPAPIKKCIPTRPDQIRTPIGIIKCTGNKFFAPQLEKFVVVWKIKIMLNFLI